jgi:hypothetical protein
MARLGSKVRFQVWIGDEAADWFEAYEQRQIKLFGHDFGGDAYILEVQ